jgi:D-inositol-3-phosphate glycosyltransferase
MTILMLGTVNSPHVEHLALAMRARGHRVVVGGEATPAYPPSVLPEAGIDTHVRRRCTRLWARSLALRVRPDVVHAHWMTGYGLLAARARLRPLIAMAWGSDVFGVPARQEALVREVVRRADATMADSRALLDRLVALGAEPAAAHLLNWGVDLEAFSPAEDRGAIKAGLGLQAGPVVLSPRALGPVYNPGVVLEAFERAAVPGAQLVLKHLGPDAPDLGRALPAGTRVIGHVPYQRLADHYRAADVAVVPSHNESFGLVALEAQACGTPVVAAAVGGLRTAVRDGFSGLLVDGHDPRDYATAVRSVLARRELLSAGARRHAALFSWDRTADALVAAYTSAAEDMAGAPRKLRSRTLGPLRALPGVQVAR